MQDRFIREDECRQLTGLSRTTRWREERAGRFPKRYRITPNVSAYSEAELQAWMEKQTREVDHE